MSAPSPPILPISNNKPTTTTTTTTPVSAVITTTSTQSQAPIQSPAFRAYVNHLYESLRYGFSQRRPWYELVDRSGFSKPESVSDATFRIRKNYTYFRVNYMAVVTAIVAFSLLSHPFSLFLLLGLLSSWIFFYLVRPSDRPLIMFGRSYSDRETLGILILLSVFVVFLTSVGSVLMSAVMVGVAIVCAHGAFRVPEDMFLDGQDPASTGFLSFLGGAASNAAAAAAPAVAGAATRV